MGRKAIFLDVDGTLTLPNGQVSQKVEEAISKVRKNGHYVFLCTGRNKAEMCIRDSGWSGHSCT